MESILRLPGAGPQARTAADMNRVVMPVGASFSSVRLRLLRSFVLNSATSVISVTSPLPPEPRDFRRAASVSQHLIAREVGRGRDPLDLELELIDVGCPSQRFFDGHEYLLIEIEDRLIEGLDAVLRGARRDRSMDLRGAILVDDAVANEA